MKLSRLLLPAVGLFLCICAVGAAASLSGSPITVPQEVLQKLGKLPIPPLQMLGEATEPAASELGTIPRSNAQPQLDLSSLPTESRRQQNQTPLPSASSSSPIPMVSGGFLPDHSAALPASPRIRLRRPPYQSTPNSQTNPNPFVPTQPLDIDSMPNPGPAGARRSTPAAVATQPRSTALPGLQAPIAPPIFPNAIAPTFPLQQSAPQSTLDHGQACPCGCQPTCTTQTIIVPCWETRYVNSLQTKYRPETRQHRSRRYYTVYDNVPKVETYTVKVPEPRTRTYTVDIPKEYQEPRQENFTVMVAKPEQREETVERTEKFQIPVVTPYTVMVPERQQYQETTYKTVKDRIPVQKKYVQNVTKTKKRIVTTYKKQPFTKTVRTPVVRMVEETRTRPKVRYVSEVVTQTFEEPTVVYEDDVIKKTVTRYRTENRTRTIQEKAVVYDQKVGTYSNPETDQEIEPYSEKVEYKVTSPYTETVKPDLHGPCALRGHGNSLPHRHSPGTRHQVPRDLSRPWPLGTQRSNLPYLLGSPRRMRLHILLSRLTNQHTKRLVSANRFSTHPLHRLPRRPTATTVPSSSAQVSQRKSRTQCSCDSVHERNSNREPESLWLDWFAAHRKVLGNQVPLGSKNSPSHRQTNARRNRQPFLAIHPIQG